MNFSNFTRPPSGWFDALFVPVALLVAFGSSLFLRGTGSVLFVPALTGVFAASAFLLFKNLRTGAGLPGNVGSVFLFLFWLYLGVSLSWSTVPFMSTLFFLILGSLPLLFFSLVGAPKIVLRYTAIGIGGGLGVLALWALVQFFFFYDSYGPRIHHPLMNPNNLAALFNMGLFVALGLYAAAPNKKTSLLTAGLVGLFLAALLVTQSRGGFLACLLAGGVFLLGTVPQGSLSGRKLWGLFCIGALVLLALSFQKGRAPAAEIVSSLPAIGATATVTGRTALWESGRAMFMDHPLLGTGLASFPYYYGRYRNPLDTSDGYFVHMDPLQFAIETGILAPILFYGFLLAVLLRTLGALSHAGLARGQRLGILTPFCALLTLALHSHISFHLYMLPVLILAALLLAFWHRAAESITPQTTPCLVFPPRGKIATVVFVGGCVFFAVAGLWVARAGLETYFVTQARQAMAARDFPAGKTAIDRLCRFGPATSFRCGQYQALWDLDRLESDPSLRTDERIALIRRAFRSLDTAEHYHPAFSRIPYIRAQLYLASGDDGAAIAALTKAIAMNPVFLEAWRLLASIYKNRGETRKAIDTLHQAMLWPRPRDPASEIDLLMRIAFLYRDIGDVDHYDIYFFRARDIAEKQKKRHYSHLNNQ